ncbi:hypothetical protein MSIMFI_05157 [Mycobacterium simulans]|nr:hypothetical protein MSIMFI_05157 [Mycobacterium simulans]
MAYRGMPPMRRLRTQITASSSGFVVSSRLTFDDAGQLGCPAADIDWPQCRGSRIFVAVRACRTRHTQFGPYTADR